MAEEVRARATAKEQERARFEAEVPSVLALLVGTHLTCFTSTTVQTLTAAEEQERARVEAEAAAAKAQTAAELKEAEERGRAGMFIQQMPTYAYACVCYSDICKAEERKQAEQRARAGACILRMLTCASSVC